MSQVFSTNQKLMGIKFNTTGILLQQRDILRVCRGCWARHEAEGEVWLDSQPLTATTKAAGRIPLLSVTQQTPILQQKPLLQHSSVWLERFPSNECSASGGKPLHFLLLHSPRLCVRLRDCSACLRKCLWSQPDIAGIWVTVTSQNKHATKRLDFICAAKHKDHWHNQHERETRHGLKSTNAFPSNIFELNKHSCRNSIVIQLFFIIKTPHIYSY